MKVLLLLLLLSTDRNVYGEVLEFCVLFLTFPNPGDIMSWESPQTLPALFIGPFDHVKQFVNLKFAVIRVTNIQSTVLDSSEGTAAIDLAFK